MYMYIHNHLNSNFKVTLLHNVYTHMYNNFIILYDYNNLIYSTHNTNRRHSFFAIKSDIKLYNHNTCI